MAITTTYVTSSAWSMDRWLDCWGDGVDAEAVLDWMVESFNRRTGEMGSSAYWLPYTSEVVGTHPSDLSFDEPEEIDFDAIREEIAEEAGEIICDGGDRGRALGFWSDDDSDLGEADDSDCPSP